MKGQGFKERFLFFLFFEMRFNLFPFVVLCMQHQLIKFLIFILAIRLQTEFTYSLAFSISVMKITFAEVDCCRQLPGSQQGVGNKCLKEPCPEVSCFQLESIFRCP